MVSKSLLTYSGSLSLKVNLMKIISQTSRKLSSYTKKSNYHFLKKCADKHKRKHFLTECQMHKETKPIYSSTLSKLITRHFTNTSKKSGQMISNSAKQFLESYQRNSYNSTFKKEMQIKSFSNKSKQTL